MNNKIVSKCLIVFAIFFFSCSNKKQDIERAVNEWIGREIVLPVNVKMKLGMKDTSCQDLFNKDFKIVIYVDSSGCTSCKFKIFELRNLIRTTINNHKNVSFLIYFNLKNYFELQHRLVSNDFNYPVIFDYDDRLNSVNKLSKNSNFHTFLLDKNNEIILIGDPIGRPKLWNLYLQQISK